MENGADARSPAPFGDDRLTARPRLLAAAALLAALALVFGRSPPEPRDPCEAHRQAYPCALFAPTAAAPVWNPVPGAIDSAADGTS